MTFHLSVLFGCFSGRGASIACALGRRNRLRSFLGACFPHSGLHAEGLAVNVNGVTYLHNRLSVVPSKHFVDELIARDIAAALDRTIDINVNDIDIQVENGNVVINGTVSNWTAYRTAENFARLTDGVTDVINNLIIS